MLDIYCIHSTTTSCAVVRFLIAILICRYIIPLSNSFHLLPSIPSCPMLFLVFLSLSFVQRYPFDSLVESISIQSLHRLAVRQLLSNYYWSIIFYRLSFAIFSFVTFTLFEILIDRWIASISVNSNTFLLLSFILYVSQSYSITLHNCFVDVEFSLFHNALTSQYTTQICDYSSGICYSIAYYLVSRPLSTQSYSQIYMFLVSSDFMLPFNIRFLACASMQSYLILWILFCIYSAHFSAFSRRNPRLIYLPRIPYLPYDLLLLPDRPDRKIKNVSALFLFPHSWTFPLPLG